MIRIFGPLEGSASAMQGCTVGGGMRRAGKWTIGLYG